MTDFHGAVGVVDEFMTKEADGHYVWRPCLNMHCYGDPAGDLHYHKAKLYFTPDEWMDCQKFKVVVPVSPAPAPVRVLPWCSFSSASEESTSAPQLKER